MALSLSRKFFNFIVQGGPLILLYFLSISETDTQFSSIYQILSFNFQIIIIYYWTLRDPNILGNGHIFSAGIINDLVMALPLGTSAISYLTVSFVASYIRNMTVNMTLFTDWFTFLIAIFFSNAIYLLLISNFSNFQYEYKEVLYNAFFTFMFFPIFWVIFGNYKKLLRQNWYDK